MPLSRRRNTEVVCINEYIIRARSTPPPAFQIVHVVVMWTHTSLHPFESDFVNLRCPVCLYKTKGENRPFLISVFRSNNIYNLHWHHCVYCIYEHCWSSVIECILFSLFSAVVGLLYPCLDSHLGEPHKFKREWASVMRCIAVFVGINHASAVSLPVSLFKL